MEWINTEKKSGYSIWQNSDNEQYIVIDGLDPNQIHSPGAIESFLIQHYDALAVAYWLLIIATFAYVIIRHIIVPLYRRKAQGHSIFSNE